VAAYCSAIVAAAKRGMMAPKNFMVNVMGLKEWLILFPDGKGFVCIPLM
jgi:hypothetical protein